MVEAPTVTNIVIARLGEAIAAKYLQAKGYELLAQNWRAGRFGEIDLILRRKSDALLVFAEVKTRRIYDAEAGFANSGLDSIDWSKRRKILTIARSYLAGHRNAGPGYQCDAILVTYKSVQPDGNYFRMIEPNVLHIPGAFDSV